MKTIQIKKQNFKPNIHYLGLAIFCMVLFVVFFHFSNLTLEANDFWHSSQVFLASLSIIGIIYGLCGFVYIEEFVWVDYEIKEAKK